MAGLQYCTLLGNEVARNSTLEMNAIFSTQTFTLIYQTTLRHIPDDHNFICLTTVHTHTHTFLDHSKMFCYLKETEGLGYSYTYTRVNGKWCNQKCQLRAARAQLQSVLTFSIVSLSFPHSSMTCAVSRRPCSRAEALV
jgi:hypothetical protein